MSSALYAAIALSACGGDGSSASMPLGGAAGALGGAAGALGMAGGPSLGGAGLATGGGGTGGGLEQAGTADILGAGAAGLEDAAGAPATGGSGGSAGPTVGVSVTVKPTQHVGNVGARFAGFSYEKNRVATSFFRPNNTALIQLFKLLGPGVLRVGGNTADETTWAPGGKGATQPLIAPADVDALAGFAKAAGWTVIYGVNMATNSASAAAAEAAYAAKALGPSLAGFEIGNECDLYHSNGLRPKAWTYTDFVKEWQTLRVAMHAAAPSAPFTGAAATSTSFSVPFAKDAAADIVLLTQHYYRGNGQSASSTLTELLKPDPALITSLDALHTAATGNHVKQGYRLAETNSFYNGGAPGVSNAYGAALWMIDFLFTNALHGSSGVNLHGGGNGTGYTPIADAGEQVVGVRPDYYGMLLFTLAGSGPLLSTTTNTGGLNFTAYAVAASGGSTRLVLVNKDATRTAHVAVSLGAAATSASELLLTGARLSETSGYTLGGKTIGIDGTFDPEARVVPVSGDLLDVNVPPASAVLLQVS